MFWVLILTNHSINPGIDSTSATGFANTTAFLAAHELTETFTDRVSGFGFSTTNMANPNSNGCEICDICQVVARDPTKPCCDYVEYDVDDRVYQVPYVWSNWDNSCIAPFVPISIKKFLQTIGIDGSHGLRQLNADTINVDFVAEVVAAANGLGL